MLDASVLSKDPATNLQLALGVELAVLPPYLYALWSIRPREMGASQAAVEAGNSIRAVVYEEMLHAGLVGNLLNAIRTRPRVTAHLMRYPGPLPGHTTEKPYAYTVGLGPLSPTTVATFVKIEQPDWEPATAPGWITLGEFYERIKAQFMQLAPGAFDGGHQLSPSQNPGPGQMIDVDDLSSAIAAIETVIDQGEGHKPKQPDDLSAEDDDDHEVAHYYQFTNIDSYFKTHLIDPEQDLHPVIDNPQARLYTPEQQALNRRFNVLYSALLDSLQAMFDAEEPRAFGPPAELMRQLGQLAAALRNAGPVPGTDRLAGPTFDYLGSETAGAT
jgi:hypothetical protein